MADYHTLGLNEVQTLTNRLNKDIKESPAALNAEIFARLGINVLSGTEYQDSVMNFRRKGGEARRYKEGDKRFAKAGYLEERKLEAKLAWAHYAENIQRFREKEPFSILGTNNNDAALNAPVSEFIIRQIAKNFSEDILNCLFFGDRDLEDSPYNLYDGIWKLVDKEIKAGKIGKGMMNYTEISPFIDPASGNERDNYQNFVAFVDSWHPNLRNAEHVIVYMSPATHRRIITSYMLTFTGLQTSVTDSASFRFATMPNIELRSHAVMGDGNRLLATLPGNIDFGLDSLNDLAGATVDRDQDDHNILLFQIQSAQGMRINDVSGASFCVSNLVNKPIDGLAGDYQKDTFKAISNDETMGKVTVSPEKTEYVKGESITLTPAPESGHKFVKWADGATLNPRTIVYSGFPEVQQAIFEKE